MRREKKMLSICGIFFFLGDIQYIYNSVMQVVIFFFTSILLFHIK
jgi:hypothetical protein